MTATTLVHLAEDQWLLYRHTVETYHRMIPNGIVEEGAPFELLDGLIVRKLRSAIGGDPTRVSPHHAWVVGRLSDLSRRLERRGCHLRTQQPVTLPPFDEPEPDGSIVAGRIRDYSDRHPGAADVLCVIEVADASLRRDREYKQRLYANNSIPTYLIVNLPGRVVEVYTEPINGCGRYGRLITLSPKETVEIPAARGQVLKVPVRRLLP